MSWVKKGPLLRLVGGLLLSWLLIHFFFDPVLKFALIKAGQTAARARVDIDSLSTHWLNPRLEIRGVSIANSKEPMKNLVQISNATFAFNLAAALEGKFVVREAALLGLRFGTARKTSGALPKPPPPSNFEMALESQIAPAKGAAIAQAAQVKTNTQTQVDATKLKGLQKLDEAKSKAKEIEERWKAKQSKAQEFSTQAKELSNEIKQLQAGGNSSLEAIAQKATKAKELQQKIKELLSRVESERALAKKDIAEAQNVINEANALRGKDLNELLASAGLPTLDAQDLARRLLGAQTASRLNTALQYMSMAKKYAAKRKATQKSSPPPVARRKGIDIEFPKNHAWPAFLLQNAKLSGSLDDVILGGGMELSGELEGVTSNPTLYGKPASLNLKAQAKSGQTFILKSHLDQQKDPIGVFMHIEATGISLSELPLGDNEIGGQIKSGRASVNGYIQSEGDQWKGEINLEALNVSLEPRVSLNGPLGVAAKDALKSINSFTIRVGINGSEENLKFSFASNIGDVLAQAIKKSVSSQLTAQRQALESQINTLYNNKLKEVTQSTEGLTGKILGPLDGQKSELEHQLQDVLKKAVGTPQLPNFKKLFK